MAQPLIFQQGTSPTPTVNKPLIFGGASTPQPIQQPVQQPVAQPQPIQQTLGQKIGGFIQNVSNKFWTGAGGQALAGVQQKLGISQTYKPEPYLPTQYELEKIQTGQTPQMTPGKYMEEL